MRFFKATALALVAAISATSIASATGYNQPSSWGWTPPARTVTYHGHGNGHGHGHGHGYGHSNWGHYNNYASYHVHGVGYHDHLNVRYGPGVRNHVVFRLPYNAHGVRLQDCTIISTSHGPSRWCLVHYQGYVRGWVNSRYLA